MSVDSRYLNGIGGRPTPRLGTAVPKNPARLLRLWGQYSRTEWRELRSRLRKRSRWCVLMRGLAAHQDTPPAKGNLGGSGAAACTEVLPLRFEKPYSRVPISPS